MSKVIYVCRREACLPQEEEVRLTRICEELEPDNLVSRPQHVVRVNGRVAFGIMNRQSFLLEEDSSLLVGRLYTHENRWKHPGTGLPDGSYALFRNDEDYLEVASDPAASRTIWHYFDDDLFVASTSQRAIIMLVGGFEFDERVIPWMLSTGSLGPELSWDKRIGRLPPDSSVVLDKNHWSVSMSQRPVLFSARERSRSDQREALRAAIDKTIASLTTLNYEEWAIPLSGGHDSRALLCLIREHSKTPGKLRTITWGLEASMNEPGNDATIARELADKLGVAHEYYHTDVSKEPIEKVIDRFISCSEGRTDQVSGYLDGLELWRKLVEEEGVRGVIRGDEGFGWTPVSSSSAVRYRVGCALCSDFANIETVVSDFGLPLQELPADMQRQEGESLGGWRDRLYHTFRIPTILAALSDIKLSYVEQISPLLSRSVLETVRELPDDLRTDKALFKEVVDSICPGVPYATKDAIAVHADALRRREFVELLRDGIQSEYAKHLLSPGLVAYILGGIRAAGPSGERASAQLKRSLRLLVPGFLKDWLKDTAAKPRVDGSVLAFRIFIVLRMHEKLSSDCARIK